MQKTRIPRRLGAEQGVRARSRRAPENRKVKCRGQRCSGCSAMPPRWSKPETRSSPEKRLRAKATRDPAETSGRTCRLSRRHRELPSSPPRQRVRWSPFPPMAGDYIQRRTESPSVAWIRWGFCQDRLLMERITDLTAGPRHAHGLPVQAGLGGMTEVRAIRAEEGSRGWLSFLAL